MMSISGIFGQFTNALKKSFENDSEFQNEKSQSQPNSISRGRNFQKVRYPNLLGTRWNLTLALSGLPLNDPSSDLFAPSSKIEKTEVLLEVEILEDGLVSIKDNDFTVQNISGKWKLDEGSGILALSFACIGFERNIKTRGSILNVYGGEDSLRTTSTYIIPSGTCLVQCSTSMSETGRIFLRDGVVYGKDPNNANRGRWSQAAEWIRTGSVLNGIQLYDN